MPSWYCLPDNSEAAAPGDGLHLKTGFPCVNVAHGGVGVSIGDDGGCRQPLLRQ